jgi:hypothetical protein
LPNDTPQSKAAAPVDAKPKNVPAVKAQPGDEDQDEDTDKGLDSDYQLSRALDLLRGIALFQQKVAN